MLKNPPNFIKYKIQKKKIYININTVNMKFQLNKLSKC